MTSNPHAARHRPAARLLCAVLLAGGLHLAASADEGLPRSPAAPLPAYQQECAACHLAYPPGLLPAASWQRLMGNLSRHFGTDASLDAATTRQISGWLAAHAGSQRRQRATPPQDRITASAWFRHEHDEIASATWTRAAVKSAANCGACHTRADHGDFDEHHVRIPR